MRTIATITSIGACVVALATAGCGASSSPGSSTTAPAQTEPPPAAEAPGNGQPAPQWVMPDVAGSILQDAQDQIQALTAGAVYFTESHDLSGQDRYQVMDDNWKICTQNIAPGAALASTSKIDFGVVKLDEACP